MTPLKMAATSTVVGSPNTLDSVSSSTIASYIAFPGGSSWYPRVTTKNIRKAATKIIAPLKISLSHKILDDVI